MLYNLNLKIHPLAENYLKIIYKFKYKIYTISIKWCIFKIGVYYVSLKTRTTV